MKRADVLLIAIVLAAALIFLVPRWLGSNDKEPGQNLVANVTVDGKHYQTIPLTKEEKTVEIRTDLGYNILKIHDCGVEMYEADCPDQVCLGFGFITQPKQTIVCLPHRVLVEIEGQTGEEEVDVYVN